jgi:hypothetical protein
MQNKSLAGGKIELLLKKMEGGIKNIIKNGLELQYNDLNEEGKKK